MKKILLATITVFLSVMVANVQAADVRFNPGSVDLTVEPGESTVADLVVKGNSRNNFRMILRLGNLLTRDSTVPRGWISPVEVSLVAATRGVTSTSSAVSLDVNVPADTPAGIYRAVVKPQVLRATEPVVSSGVPVIIEVLSQEACVGKPKIENVLFGPEDIWAPKGTAAKIKITGTVIVAPGCEFTGSYSMASDDGLATGDFTTDENGNFALEIDGKFSKNAKDKEGTIYDGKLTVVDDNSESAEHEFFVTVGHDRGKKKGQK